MYILYAYFKLCICRNQVRRLDRHGNDPGLRCFSILCYYYHYFFCFVLFKTRSKPINYFKLYYRLTHILSLSLSDTIPIILVVHIFLILSIYLFICLSVCLSFFFVFKCVRTLCPLNSIDRMRGYEHDNDGHSVELFYVVFMCKRLFLIFR